MCSTHHVSLALHLKPLQRIEEGPGNLFKMFVGMVGRWCATSVKANHKYPFPLPLCTYTLPAFACGCDVWMSCSHLATLRWQGGRTWVFHNIQLRPPPVDFSRVKMSVPVPVGTVGQMCVVLFVQKFCSLQKVVLNWRRERERVFRSDFTEHHRADHQT